MANLNLAGLVLSLLFISLILTKREKQLHDYLLAFFIFLLGIFLIVKYVFQNEIQVYYPLIIILDIYYWVLFGPVLYVYTLVISRGENRLQINYLYTLIPAILVTILFFEFIFINPLGLFEEGGNFTIYSIIGAYIWTYNSLVFYVLTIITLKRHQKKIKRHYSFSKSVDLKWLYYLSNGFVVFLFFLLWRPVIKNLIGFEIPFDDYSIPVGVVVFYIFGIGFFGYKQRGVFNNLEFDEPSELKRNSDASHIKNKELYQKSGLSKEEALSIKNKLKTIMEVEQPYLECELDLPTLAKMVEVSTHKLSQVINENLGKNFFDFVNEYRIEKVKEHLSDPDNNRFKIIALAYQSGFNSKSTFYNLFKKMEGITPTEYRSKHQ